VAIAVVAMKKDLTLQNLHTLFLLVSCIAHNVLSFNFTCEENNDERINCMIRLFMILLASDGSYYM
jgi:hypothetical protein